VAKTNAIFVIDDDPSFLKSVGRALTAHGFETQLFSSAESFQQTDQGEASCLVLDIQLGGMSGIDLRRELARSGSQIPVVFITADDNERTKRAANEAGCTAYLTKPFSPQALLDAVNRALSVA
jgi:FixJ family two-component response regulator